MALVREESRQRLSAKLMNYDHESPVDLSLSLFFYFYSFNILINHATENYYISFSMVGGWGGRDRNRGNMKN